MELNGPNIIEVELNGSNKTEVDQYRPNKTEMNYMDRIEPKWTEVDQNSTLM